LFHPLSLLSDLTPDILRFLNDFMFTFHRQNNSATFNQSILWAITECPPAQEYESEATFGMHIGNYLKPEIISDIHY
jgi:hypothetical protein